MFQKSHTIVSTTSSRGGVLRGVVPKQAESHVGYTPETAAGTEQQKKQMLGTKHILSYPKYLGKGTYHVLGSLYSFIQTDMRCKLIQT